MKDKQKLLAAKPDVEAAINKHGFAAVKYVINKLSEKHRLEKQLNIEKKKMNQRISEIQEKLKGK